MAGRGLARISLVRSRATDNQCRITIITTATTRDTPGLNSRQALNDVFSTR
jgi:hypothetical protein